MTKVSQEALAELHPIEREMIAQEQAARDAGSPLTLEQLGEVHARIVADRHQRLARDASASWRAMKGWGKVTTQEEWRPRSSRPTTTTTAASSCSIASALSGISIRP